VSRVLTRSFRYLPALAALAAAAFAPSVAGAQTAGWALDRFEPSPAGDNFFTAEHPWYGHGRPFAFRAGLVFDYAHTPLVLRETVGGQERVTPIVSDMLVGSLQAGIGLSNRVNIHLSLPISFWQDGAAVAVGGLGASSSAALGDPRIGVRVRVLGESDRDAFSLHVGAALYLNAGLFGVSPGSNVTDDGFRGRLNATLAGREGPIRWSFSLGAHLRQNTVTVMATTIGSDLFASAGVAYVALEDRLSIGPEIWASTVLDNAFEGKHNNFEGLLGVNYLIADAIQVGAGVGPGFARGAGTPDWRAVARVQYAPSERDAAAPPPADADSDGVLDPDDVCPTTPQGAHPDPARLGCPLTDTDGDGVFDNEDQCVTEPMGPNPDPSRRGCPRRDTDGDTVFDDEDQCVNEPQGPNPDAQRRGCPDGDEDRDGVLNSADQCRTVPQGPLPDPARPGCPLPDRDRDTVPDNTDHCPDEPGVPSTDPQRNGCPNRFVVVDGTAIRLLQPVFFAINRDVILPQSAGVLTAVGDVLRASPWIHRVRIEGHTDDSNTDEYNLDLSQRRSNNVMRWLVQNGISQDRLEARGFGEARPLRPIDGLTGPALRDARSTNRRVMFIVVDPSFETAPNGNVQIPAR
jgi:outer membrane protein OmpA-like peptidoglycan-associated protein